MEHWHAGLLQQLRAAAQWGWTNWCTGSRVDTKLYRAGAAGAKCGTEQWLLCAGDALTKHVSPSRGKIMAAQLSVATTFPFTILLLKVTASLPCCRGDQLLCQLL